MFKFIVRRILWSIPVLLLVILFTFLLMKAIPGGPFTGEKGIPPEILANMNAKYGLDKPWFEQYARYVWHAFRGDLGVSMTQKSRTVMDIIGSAFPVSMQLGIQAFLLAILIGLPAGIIAGLRHTRGWTIRPSSTPPSAGRFPLSSPAPS